MGSIETLRWNRVGAFERYFKAEEEKERAARGNEQDDEDEDTEGELDPDMVYPCFYTAIICKLTTLQVVLDATTLRDVVIPVCHFFESSHTISYRTIDASTYRL